MDLGELKVRFGADSSQLLRASQNVKTALGSVSDRMRRATVATAKYAGAITGLGIAISTVMVKKQLEAADALAKASDKLGVQTERLQALQHVGELTGATLEEVNDALKDMEIRLGEATRKGGDIVKTFQSLGLNVQELLKLSPDRQFEKIAVAIANLESQSAKASIAQEIFGEAGIKTLNLMERLKQQGIEPTVRELEQLGISLNRVNAAKIEAANDSMLRFNKAVQGAFQSLAIELAPILEAVSNELIQMIKNAGGFERVAGQLVDSAVSGFGTVLDVIALVSRAIKKIGDGISFVLQGVKKLASFAIDVENIKVTPAGKKLFAQINDSIFGDLPSTKLKQFVANAEKAAQEAGEKVQAAVDSRVLTGDFKIPETPESQKLNRSGGNRESELESFRESLMSEEELELASYQKRLEQLGEFIKSKQLTEDEANAARQTIEQQHQDELTRIQSDAFRQRMQLISSTLQTQVSNVADSLKLITGVAGKEGKKQFEITKVASIATALIKGTESVVSSYAAGAKLGGPVLGAAFAATAAGTVGAQIAQIKSQQYNGGSSGGGAGISGGGGGAVAGQQAQPAQRQRGINIQGINPNDLFTGDQIKNLIEKINEEVEDGSVLISTGFAA